METHQHIVKCQSDRATKAFRNIEREFETWLKHTTSDDIRLAIMAHLKAYREDEDVGLDDLWAELVLEVSRTQRDTGDNSFMEGLLVYGWD